MRGDGVPSFKHDNKTLGRTNQTQINHKTLHPAVLAIWKLVVYRGAKVDTTDDDGRTSSHLP